MTPEEENEQLRKVVADFMFLAHRFVHTDNLIYYEEVFCIADDMGIEPSPTPTPATPRPMVADWPDTCLGAATAIYVIEWDKDYHFLFEGEKPPEPPNGLRIAVTTREQALEEELFSAQYQSILDMEEQITKAKHLHNYTDMEALAYKEGQLAAERAHKKNLAMINSKVRNNPFGANTKNERAYEQGVADAKLMIKVEWDVKTHEEKEAARDVAKKEFGDGSIKKHLRELQRKGR